MAHLEMDRTEISEHSATSGGVLQWPRQYKHSYNVNQTTVCTVEEISYALLITKGVRTTVG